MTTRRRPCLIQGSVCRVEDVNGCIYLGSPWWKSNAVGERHEFQTKWAVEFLLDRRVLVDFESELRHTMSLCRMQWPIEYRNEEKSRVIAILLWTTDHVLHSLLLSKISPTRYLNIEFQNSWKGNKAMISNTRKSYASHFSEKITICKRELQGYRSWHVMKWLPALFAKDMRFKGRVWRDHLSDSTNRSLTIISRLPPQITFISDRSLFFIYFCSCVCFSTLHVASNPLLNVVQNDLL